MNGKWGHLALFLALTWVLQAPQAEAANARSGAQKAITCQICHGPLGRSTNPIYPKLANQHAKYTIKQLQAFKNGERRDPIMKEIASGMSNADMQDVAAYFESVK